MWSSQCTAVCHILRITVISTSGVHLGIRYSKKSYLLQQKYLQCVQAVTEVLSKSHFSLQVGNCPIPVAEHSGNINQFYLLKEILKNIFAKPMLHEIWIQYYLWQDWVPIRSCIDIKDDSNDKAKENRGTLTNPSER